MGDEIFTDRTEVRTSDQSVDAASDIGAIGASFFGGIGNDSGGSSGSDSGGTERFDPAIHVGEDRRNRDGSFTRKRGRRSGSSASRSKSRTDTSASVEALTRMLAVVHIGLAAVAKSPELVLEDKEAESLAEATANVLTEFDIRPSPKAEAIFGLVVCSSMIYGPRMYLILERKKAEKEAADNERQPFSVVR